MQAITQKTLNEEKQQSPVVVSVATIAVVVLVLISLALRLGSLHSVPISETETRQALSAWRAVSPQAPGEDIVSASPVVFWAQATIFSLLGSSEGTARLLTAVAGVLLSLSPLLFRDLLGQARSYIFATFLVISPVFVAASRFSSGAVWAMLFAMIGLWALWRWWEEKNDSRAVLATVSLGALILLSEPGGPALFIILLGSAAIALFLTTLEAPVSYDVPGNDLLALVFGRFQKWPWLSAIGLLSLVVVAVSSGFLLYPGGLSMVGALFDGFVDAFSERTVGTPFVFPVMISLFYETWLWLLALVAVIAIVVRGQVTFVERFFVAWIIIGFIMSLFYVGAEAAHGLWLVMPLAGLSSYIAAEALVEYDFPAFWFGAMPDDDDVNKANALRGKWIVAIAVFVLLLIAALQFQIVARFFHSVPDGTLKGYVERLQAGTGLPNPNPAIGVIWLLVSLLFVVIGGFMAASIWSEKVALQGGLLGLIAFVLLSSVGSAWNLSVADADDPLELWHIEPISRDARFLRETMLEFSFRETQGFPTISVTVIAENDGAVAWLLRDFDNLKFVDSVDSAKDESIVILPQTENNNGMMLVPDLAGHYVGKNFVISYTWSEDLMRGFDFLAWWSTRDVRLIAGSQTSDIVELWVRQDIYNSQPFVGVED
jgi:4-amino-4-deoxy-L-arabinose transferase-like glycosyltransferase